MSALTALTLVIVLIEIFRQAESSVKHKGHFSEIPTALYVMISMILTAKHIWSSAPRPKSVSGTLGLASLVLVTTIFGYIQYHVVLFSLQYRLHPAPLRDIWHQLDPFLPYFPLLASGAAVGSFFWTTEPCTQTEGVSSRERGYHEAT